MATQPERVIDIGNAILHRQEGFDAKIVTLDDGYGVECTACGGLWQDVYRAPVRWERRSSAERGLARHNRFEHRERISSGVR